MAAKDLTTVAKVKSWANITDANSDVLLADLVTRASQYVLTYLSREIKQANISGERINGNGRTRIMPREWPITAISSLKVSGIVVPASVDGLLNGYAFDDRNIYLLPGSNVGVFSEGVRNVEVSYTAGYEAIPEDIEQAAIEYCAKKYKDRARIGLTSEGMAGQQTSFSQSDLTADTQANLKRYKRVF